MRNNYCVIIEIKPDSTSGALWIALDGVKTLKNFNWNSFDNNPTANTKCSIYVVIIIRTEYINLDCPSQAWLTLLDHFETLNETGVHRIINVHCQSAKCLLAWRGRRSWVNIHWSTDVLLHSPLVLSLQLLSTRPWVLLVLTQLIMCCCCYCVIV